MITRKANWIITSLLVVCLNLTATIKTQNVKSYDTNDWVPISRANQQDSNDQHQEELPTKRATGRVLNLDPSKPKIYSDNEYVQQTRPTEPRYLHEQVVSKSSPQSSVQHQFNIQQPYKYENILPGSISSSGRQNQYYIVPTNNNQDQIKNQQQFKYIPQQQQYYQHSQIPNNNHPSINQYQIPFNNSFYQSLNPGSINQEILGAIENNENVQNGATQPVDKDSVQLLYVPLENLKQLQQQPPQSVPAAQLSSRTIFNNQDTTNNNNNPQQLNNNDINKQFSSRTAHFETNNNQLINNIEQNLIRQALESQKLQNQLQLGEEPALSSKVSTISRPAQKKRKAHQPPLAVYMGADGNHADVTDVLNVLKNAKTISVQDNVGPDSPHVFVGPSNLNPPDGYTKFPLPYLSSIEGNNPRVERKIDHLPFFVAPLSYKAPTGYSKIPLPSPHVGSVVVSNKDEIVTTTTTTTTTPKPFSTYHQSPVDYYSRYNDAERFPSATVATSFSDVTKKNALRNQDNNDNLRLINLFATPSFDGTPQNQYNAATTQETYIPNYQVDAKQNVPDQQYQTRFPPFTLRNVNINTKPEQLNQNFQPSSSSSVEQQQYHSSNIAVPSGTDVPPQNIPSQYQYQGIDDGLSQYRTHKYPSTTSTEAAAISYYDITTTPLYQTTTQRTRKRQRTTRPPTVFTTPRSIYTNPPNDKYTVLEEFSAVTVPKTTTVKYTTEVETIPAQVYKIAPVHIENEQIKQHILNQDMLDKQIFNKERNNNNIPSSSSSVEIQQSHQPQLQDHSQQQILSSSYDDNNNHQTVDNYNSPQINSYLPNLINNLQDQSLKSLLVPNLLAPTTTEKLNLASPITYQYHNNNQFVPEELTTTRIIPDAVEPTEPTTTRRVVVESTTTPYRGRTRGRQRNGNGSSNRSTSTSPTRQRNPVNRRRPLHHTRTTTTEPSTTPGDYSYETYTTTRRTPSSSGNHQRQQQQRFRTRGRPAVHHHENSATDRISSNPQKIATTRHNDDEETDNKHHRFELSGGFQPSTISKEPPPQSYMQFEHTIDNQELITVQPPSFSRNNNNNYSKLIDDDKSETLRNYHEIYNYPSSTDSSSEEIIINNNDGASSSSKSKPVVDIQINHPSMIIDDKTSVNENDEPLIITKPTVDSQYVNVQSGGVLYNTRQHNNVDEHTTTPRQHHHQQQQQQNNRVRGRTRNRVRITSTTSPTIVTRKPKTTTTTTTQRVVIKSQATSKEDDAHEEFYGFIRAPNFHKHTLSTTTTTTTTQQPSPSSNSYYQTESTSPNSIRFVGEIRPKYHSSITTNNDNDEYRNDEETEAPVSNRFRTRGHHHHQNNNRHNSVDDETDNEQTTSNHRRLSNNGIRTRVRGQNHYNLPAKTKTTDNSDEDVDGGNYPVAYQVGNNPTTTPKLSSTFQITIDPYADEQQQDDDEADQETYASIYSPKVIAIPSGNNNSQWIEASALPPLNAIHNQMEDKTFQTSSDSSLEETAEDVKSKNEESTTSNKRRGVWKLIKQRPVLDQFETAESQNYHSVVNRFDEDVKKYQQTSDKTSTDIRAGAASTSAPANNIFDTFYNMMGITTATEDLSSTIAFSDTDKLLKATTTTSPNDDDNDDDSSTSLYDNFTESPTITTTVTPQKLLNNATITTESNDNVDATTSSEIVTEIPQIITTTVTSDGGATQKSVNGVEPWDMRNVVTSTSTDVSHDTEICYKGRCIKSSDRKT